MGAKKTVNHPSVNESLSTNNSFKSFALFSAALLIILCSAIYWNSLTNKLTRWDDNVYITNNTDIRTLHGDSIQYTLKKTFGSYVVGNYHPLTMLSFCIDYQRGQLNPRAYHSTSLIIHILNSLLVFVLIWLLTKQKWVALITSVLFAIHPMHVESVVWASERKDVLYAFFYLLALSTYVVYLQKEKGKLLFFLITFLVFVLAALSKAMAVSLPIAFFAIDYFLGRKIDKKIFLEKIPFIIASLIFGYVAIQAQKSVNAMHTDYYILTDRILFICYELMMYLWKFIAPIQLSCFYSYPMKVDGAFSPIVYISPIIILSLAFLIYRSMRFGKDIVFGFGFFIITLALVLQVLPVGSAIIAERYTYLPYIGLFFIVARLVNGLIENKFEKEQALKIPVIALLSIFIIVCCYLSYERTKIWRNDFTLWNDEIENKHSEATIAFKNRADAYYENKQYPLALADYNMALQKSQNKYLDVYFGIGSTYYAVNEYEKAAESLTTYIAYNNQYIHAYNLRALAYVNLKKYKEAILDLNTVLTIHPDVPDAYYTRGLCNYYLEQFEESVQDYTNAIKYNPKYSEAYGNRGLAYFSLKKYDNALADYAIAIQLNPQFANTYYNRALTYDQLKQYENAIKDYSSTIQFLPEFSGAYYQRALDYIAIQKMNEAVNDMIKAKQLGYAIDPNYIEGLKRR